MRRNETKENKQEKHIRRTSRKIHQMRIQESNPDTDWLTTYTPTHSSGGTNTLADYIAKRKQMSTDD